MLYVLGPRDRSKIAELKANGAITVNTTSRAGWSSGLSPFLIGPCLLYDGMSSFNMENGWQYSKCYAQHVGPDGNPTKEYFKWASEGWMKKRADRYPMGKGAKPEYSWWAGEKLSYVEARKRIYIPLYVTAVVKSKAYTRLKEMFNGFPTTNIVLWDFDAYDHRALGMSYKDVLDNPDRKMGHAFVLAMMLEDKELIVKTVRNCE